MLNDYIKEAERLVLVCKDKSLPLNEAKQKKLYMAADFLQFQTGAFTYGRIYNLGLFVNSIESLVLSAKNKSLKAKNEYEQYLVANAEEIPINTMFVLECISSTSVVCSGYKWYNIPTFKTSNFVFAAPYIEEDYNYRLALNRFKVRAKTLNISVFEKGIKSEVLRLEKVVNTANVEKGKMKIDLEKAIKEGIEE